MRRQRATVNLTSRGGHVTDSGAAFLAFVEARRRCLHSFRELDPDAARDYQLMRDAAYALAECVIFGEHQPVVLHVYVTRP